MAAPAVRSNARARRDELLSALARGGTERMCGDDVAVVLAHPDDETIACGALLARLDGVTVYVVTDGAPRSLADARRNGFASAEAYAERRALELQVAMQLVGVGEQNALMLGIPDQQVALVLAELSRMLAQMLAQRRTRIVVTHAWEGGHPDHDATAFAVHAAAALMRRRTGSDVAIIEVPLYHLGSHGFVRQRFNLPGGSGVTVELTAEQQALKRAMCAAHATQALVLAGFALDQERFRPAAEHDFCSLPNDGRLLYERYDWGLDGVRWRRLARAAVAELQAETAP